MQLSKETSLFSKDAIKDDIQTAGQGATSYITKVTNDGIFVHQTDSGRNGTQPTDSTAYGVHVTDKIDIIQAGKVVASYGATTTVGDTDTWGKYYIEIASDGVKVLWKSAQAGQTIPIVIMGDDGIHFFDYRTPTILMDGNGIQGVGCTNNGSNTYTLGTGLNGYGSNQVIIGKYNRNNRAPLVIGNGTSSKRSDIFVVDSSGNVNISGQYKRDGRALNASDVSALSSAALNAEYGDVRDNVGSLAFRLIKRGNVGQLTCYSGTASLSGDAIIGVLPSGFEPCFDMECVPTVGNCRIVVQSDGNIKLIGTLSGALRFGVTYVIYG